MSNVSKDKALSLALTPRRSGQQWAWLLSVLNWLAEQTLACSCTGAFLLLYYTLHIPSTHPGPLPSLKSVSTRPRQANPCPWSLDRFILLLPASWDRTGDSRVLGVDWFLLPMLHFLMFPLLLFVLYDLCSLRWAPSSIHGKQPSFSTFSHFPWVDEMHGSLPSFLFLYCFLGERRSKGAKTNLQCLTWDLSPSPNKWVHEQHQSLACSQLKPARYLITQLWFYFYVS